MIQPSQKSCRLPDLGLGPIWIRCCWCFYVSCIELYGFPHFSQLSILSNRWSWLKKRCQLWGTSACCSGSSSSEPRLCAVCFAWNTGRDWVWWAKGLVPGLWTNKPFMVNQLCNGIATVRKVILMYRIMTTSFFQAEIKRSIHHKGYGSIDIFPGKYMRRGRSS